jgi:hypothetical protein
LKGLMIASSFFIRLFASRAPVRAFKSRSRASG